MDLPDELLDLLRRPSTCFVATTMPDGSPQMTQTWVDTDGALMLTTSDPAKTRAAFESLKLPFEEHADGVDMPGERTSVFDMRGR